MGNNEITQLSPNELHHYPDHPFQLYKGERLDDLVDSVKQMGVLVPIIVRLNTNGEYEILSGHNRANAAKKAGLETVPCIIREGLSDDEASLIVTETNLIQRSFADLLPSEKAFALKHHLEALKKLNGGQGRRNDIVELIQSQESGGDSSRNADLPDNNAKNVTSSQLATKSRTDKQVAANYGLSKDTMHRFIRLTNLTQEFLDKVDENKLALISAVNISYLSMEEQNLLNRILHDTGEKLDIKKSEALKTAHNKKRKGELTEHDINKILKGEKKEAKTKNDIVKALKKTYAKYFDEDAPQEKIVYTIDRALEFFHAAIERGDIDEEDETAYEFSDFDNFNSENENEDEAVSFSDEFKPNDEKENTDNDEDSYKDEFYPDF